jgi:hypothetical protein
MRCVLCTRTHGHGETPHTHASLFPGRMIVSDKPLCVCVCDQDVCSAAHPRFFIAFLAHLVLHHACMHMMKEYTLERFFNCRRKGGGPTPRTIAAQAQDAGAVVWHQVQKPHRAGAVRQPHGPTGSVSTPSTTECACVCAGPYPGQSLRTPWAVLTSPVTGTRAS